MVRPGDLIEIGPECGAVFTAVDRFHVLAVSDCPGKPGVARLTGRWWPTTDARQVSLTVRLTGVRVLPPEHRVPERGAVVLLDHPTAPVPGRPAPFRVIDAAPESAGRIALTGWFIDADPLREVRLSVPAGALLETDPP